MSGFLPPTIAFLLGNIEDFKLKMAEAEGISAETDSKIGEAGKLGKLAFMAVGAAVAGVAVESLKLATTFDATMTRINTQDNAGLTTKQMVALKNSVVDLAGPTAQAPEALAEAMVHVYGSGIQGAQALDLLRVAAEGATIGHANLTDVTNALDAAVAVGIKGTGDYASAMGELNATVGAGDMTMQNLADALGGPMLATVKGYGLSITDVGAALAVFGDRNIRGADAATQLRLATQALAVPAAAPAAKMALEGIGLATTSLRDDLTKGGLQLALNDLNDHLLKAGYSSQTAGAFITTAFGKKAGGGLNVLMDSLASSTSNFNDKFRMVAQSGQTFAQDWATTQDTLAFKIKALESGLEGLGVKIGTYLMPFVSEGIGELEKFGSAIAKALNSQAAESAESTLKTIWSDVVRFVRDAATTVGEFEQALKPAATLLATVFLVGLEGVGKILADVVGPAIKAFGGFLKDNAGLIRDVMYPALIGLGVYLLYIKTLAAVDMFTNFVLGVGKAAGAVRDFTKATASGEIFDSMRTKVGLASAAVSGLTTSSAQLAAQEQALALQTEATAVAEQAAALQTDLASASLKAKAGNVALASLAAQGLNDNMLIEEQATEAVSMKMNLLAAAAGISTKEVTALADASLAAADAQGALADASLAAAPAEDVATTATLGLGAALGGLTIVGTVLVGIGYLADKLGQLAGVGDHTKLNLTDLKNAMLDLNAGSTQAADGISRTAVDLYRVSEMVNHNSPVQGLKDIDSSLAQLVQSGNGKAAAATVADLTTALQRQGVSLGYIHDQVLPQYNQALADQALKTKASADAASAAAGPVAALQTPFEATAKAAQDAADAMQNTADAYTTLSDNLKADKALDALKKSMLEVKGAVDQNGAGFTDNTLKALANKDAFRNATDQILAYREANIKAKTSTEGGTAAVQDANKTAADQVRALIKTWEQAGANKTEIEAYIKTIGEIPADLQTQLSVKESGLDDAIKKLDTINQKMEKIGGNDQSIGSRVQYHAAGGPIYGAGNGTSDSIPSMLSNGEYVISAAGASAVPQALLDALNTGDLNRASAILGASGSIPGGGPSFGGGSNNSCGDSGVPVVNVYVQDPGTGAWRTAAKVRVEVARYQQRNSKANLTLPGYGS